MAIYAIIETSGKQYKVEEGSKLKVDTILQEKGATVNLDRVLLVGHDATVKVGQPTVAGASVTAEILTHDRAKKILVFKKRSKKTYKKTQGHRQNYTELLVKSISGL